MIYGHLLDRFCCLCLKVLPAAGRPSPTVPRSAASCSSSGRASCKRCCRERERLGDEVRRVLAGYGREAAEEGRRVAEDTRQATEALRAAAEALRQMTEGLRQATEDARAVTGDNALINREVQATLREMVKQSRK